MSTYVVGDIHGCFREWIRFKTKIERQDTNAEYILVGDILDKGPNSFEMLQWAMERIYSGSKVQMVIGNHEAEKLDWLRYVLSNSEGEGWKDSKIARKMLSADGYGFYQICCEKRLNWKQLTEIRNWLEQLPVLIEKRVNTFEGIRKYIITHDSHSVLSICLDTSRKENLSLHTKCSSDKLGKKQDYIVVHGHVPTALEPYKSMGAVPGKIWIQGQDINVDCGFVYGVSKAKGLYGDLAALRLEDLQEFYYYNH